MRERERRRGERRRERDEEEEEGRKEEEEGEEGRESERARKARKVGVEPAVVCTQANTDVQRTPLSPWDGMDARPNLDRARGAIHPSHFFRVQKSQDALEALVRVSRDGTQGRPEAGASMVDKGLKRKETPHAF